MLDTPLKIFVVVAVYKIGVGWRSLFLRDNVNSDFELALLDKLILNSEIFASPLMLFGNVNCNKQWFRLSQ